MSLISHRHDLAEPLVALTFDDGPGPQTPAILDLFAEHGMHGTFFVLGESVEGREGELAHEIVRCQRTLGDRPAVFRPPHGEDPTRCARIAAERGIPTTALWSVDPSDWLERSSAEIARVVLREVRAGSIVDLHDCWPRRTTTDRDRTPTVEALAVVLPELAARGIRGVTVSELLAV